MTKEKKDWLWTITKEAWRLASSLGTAVFILLAVCLHLQSWMFDKPDMLSKALNGVLWAGMYSIFSIIWKVIKIWDETPAKTQVESKKTVK